MSAQGSGGGVYRRQWLQGMGWMALGPMVWARAASSPSSETKEGVDLAAAWAQGDQMYVGVVRCDVSDSTPLRVLQSLPVPTRAHGMEALRDGSLVFTSRRPGDWLVRMHGKRPAQWLWVEPDRVFNGHVLESADGRHLYTTETDLEDSQGLIGVRDAHTLEKIAEWRTGGMDPHQLLLDHDGSLVVANGGIPTQPETGRRKLRLDQMDSSIVRLLVQDEGRIAGQWRLPDTRLSLRHLAWGHRVAWEPGRHWLGIALQAEHDDNGQRAQAPVLALFDGAHLHAVPLPSHGQTFAGYGGDIGFNGNRFAVSCPRVNQMTWWQPPSVLGQTGQWVRAQEQAGAYSIGTGPRQPTLAEHPQPLWVGGSEQVVAWEGGQPAGAAGLAGLELALDNHWLKISKKYSV